MGELIFENCWETSGKVQKNVNLIFLNDSFQYIFLNSTYRRLIHQVGLAPLWQDAYKRTTIVCVKYIKCMESISSM